MIASAFMFALGIGAAEALPNEPVRYESVNSSVKAKTKKRSRAVKARAANYVSSSLGFGGGGIAARARAYIGSNPTGWGRLWCARFLRMVVPNDPGPQYNLALNWRKLGRRVSPRVNAIAVMGRRGGGHVGVVSGFDEKGNPKIISGNSRRVGRGRVVSEQVYPRTRKIIYIALGG